MNNSNNKRTLDVEKDRGGPTANGSAELKRRKALQPSVEKKQENERNLRKYYEMYFPCQLFVQFLTMNSDLPLMTREIAFSFASTTDDDEGRTLDTFARHKSFETFDRFYSYIQHTLPQKIHVGAQYSHAPLLRKLHPNTYHPMRRELVFDIDLDAYDDVRFCECRNEAVCYLCWSYVEVAIKIMEFFLRRIFGFNHILWVNSGRRGVHCWVCDKKACELTPQARSAIVNYISSACEHSIVDFTLPPDGVQTVEIIETHFEDVFVVRRKILEEHKARQQILSEFVVDKEFYEKALNAFSEKNGDSQSKWSEFKELLKTAKVETGRRYYAFLFKYFAPRLDVSVTRDASHLLKAPFSPHPATGKICLPFEAKDVEQLQPKDLPSLDEVSRSTNVYARSDRPYLYRFDESVEYFKKFITECKNSYKAVGEQE